MVIAMWWWRWWCSGDVDVGVDDASARDDDTGDTAASDDAGGDTDDDDDDGSDAYAGDGDVQCDEDVGVGDSDDAGAHDDAADDDDDPDDANADGDADSHTIRIFAVVEQSMRIIHAPQTALTTTYAYACIYTERDMLTHVVKKKKL